MGVFKHRIKSWPLSPSLKDLKAFRKTISKWSLLRWLEPEIAFGETFWPEVFSALTMLFPALHGYYMAPDIAADASFPPGVWVLLYATLFHCPVSMAYHLANAAFYGMSGYDALNTPFRTADLVAIHLCCIAFGWAESHGDISYTIFLIVINVGCILSLLHTLALGRRGGRHENYWVAFAVFLYTLPVLMRCDYINYVGIAASWCLACVFQSLGPKMGGWGHGFFHLMLVPYLHFLMRGAAATN